MLSLTNIWVEYGEKVVLERISLDIDEGAFVSVIACAPLTFRVGSGESLICKDSHNLWVVRSMGP